MECQQNTNPLLNVHVIENIFGYCKLQTLLNARVVCRTWNEEVLRLSERNGTTAYLKGDNALSEFIKCVNGSDNHPFSSFTIELPSKEESEEIYELLEILRFRMKHVRFEYEPPLTLQPEEGGNDVVIFDAPIGDYLPTDVPDSTTDGPETRIILPELTSLHLFSTNIFPPKSTNRLPKLFNLLETPKLTSLSVQHLYATECAETVLKFLNSSKTNITTLRMPCTEFPKIVGRVSLPHLKELDICDLFHGSFATNEAVRCIIEHCPNLETLGIELGFRVTFECVFKLFETLSHSIKNLKLIIQDKNLLSRTIQRVNFYFPQMPVLQTLFLRFANPGLVYFIDAMPQLTSLELETPWTRRVRGQIFPGSKNTIYQGIQTLNLSDKLNAEDVIKISKLFPNLKTLCASFQNDETLFEVYRNLRSLERLIIDRNSSVTDVGICGINNEQLSKFSESQIFGGSGHELCLGENTKVDSIADMTNLKSVKIVQTGLSWKCLYLGICLIKGLQSLAVQATTLKIKNTEISNDDSILQMLSQQLPKLTNLAIWIRRNSERLSASELKFIRNKYPQWNIDITIQTVCNTS